MINKKVSCVLYGGWAVFVLGAYYSLMRRFWPQISLSSFPMRWDYLAPALWNDFQHLLLTLWVVSVAVLWGRWTQKKWGVSWDFSFDHFCVSFGLGIGEIIAVLFVLGLLGLWFPALLVGVFLIASVAGVLLNRDLYVGRHVFVFDTESRSWTALDGFLLTLIGVQLIFLLIHALSPETSYDALVYHLAIPQLWLLHHKIFPTPTYCFSGIPMNTELLYGFCLALSDEILAKLLHFVLGLGILGVLYALGRRLLSPRAGLLAIVIFLCPPMMALEFARAAVDLTTMFYTALTALALTVAFQVSGAADRRRFLCLTGLFAGLAMGTKYTAWVLIPGLIFAVFADMQKGNRTKDAKIIFRQSAWVLIPALIVLSPWVLKNVWFYHNPIFPFLHHVFTTPGSSISNWNALRGEGARNWVEILHSWRGLGLFLIDPWRVTMGRSTGYDYLGPIYLLLLPLLLFIPYRTDMRRFVWFFLGLFIPAYLVSYYPRFWLPALTILSVLLGVAMSHPALPKMLRGVLLIVLVWAAGFNAVFSNLALMQLDSWRVVFGQLSKMENLNQPHAAYYSPYYCMAMYVNALTPADARLFLLGDARGFYYQRPYLGASKFDTQPIFQWANGSSSGETLFQKFQAEGLTHIVLNAAEAARMRPAWNDVFTSSGERVFDEFWRNHVRKVWMDQALSASQGPRAVLLYSIQDHAEGPPLPNIFLQIMDAGKFPTAEPSRLEKQ